MRRRNFLALLAAAAGLPLKPDTTYVGLDLATGPDYTVISGNCPGGPIDEYFEHCVRPLLTVHEARLREALDLEALDLEFVYSSPLPKTVGGVL